jgi:hypothetical protein
MKPWLFPSISYPNYSPVMKYVSTLIMSTIEGFVLTKEEKAIERVVFKKCREL